MQRCLWSQYTTQAYVTGNLRLTPVQFFAPCTITRLGLYVAAGTPNVRLGIYADNGDTPDGGALLAECGPAAPAAVGKFEIALGTPLSIAPGLYWFAYLHDGNITVHIPTERQSDLGTLVSRGVVQAFGAFPNPCPVTPTWTDSGLMYALVTVP